MRKSDPFDPKKYVKGLMCTVLRHADGSDFTNGGLTSKHHRVLLVGPGVEGPHDVTRSDMAVLYLHRWLMDGLGQDTMFASPSPNSNEMYMFGGNFIYASDSRFPNKQGAIPVHDRLER